MKKIKRSILSTLALACMCLLIFTEKAYADIAAPVGPLVITSLIILTPIVLIIIAIAIALIKRIRDKNDNNKFN